MNTRERLLAERREQLIARSALLRERIGREAAAVASRLQLVDRLFALARSPWLRMGAAAGASLLLFRRPRRLLRLLIRASPLLAALRPVLRPAWRPLLDGVMRRLRARRRRSEGETQAGIQAEAQVGPVSPPP
ncbi:MAG: hypothetical protein KGL34_01070 [Gammaproteobacteria bacterium]|nr:hypothetical protein [Gammaproteobacteria bacterium]